MHLDTVAELPPRDTWAAVESLRTQQDAVNQHQVREALKAGAKPLRSYYQEGKLVLLVERVTREPGEPAWPLWCVIPKEREEATLAWLTKEGVCPRRHWG